MLNYSTPFLDALSEAGDDEDAMMELFWLLVVEVRR